MCQNMESAKVFPISEKSTEKPIGIFYLSDEKKKQRENTKKKKTKIKEWLHLCSS